MSLAWALVKSNDLKEEDDERELDCDQVAQQYKEWIESVPPMIASETVKSCFAPLKDAARPKAWMAKR